jgi:hypothetical protein
MSDLTVALYACGIAVIVLAVMSLLNKAFPDESEDKEDSHFD